MGRRYVLTDDYSGEELPDDTSPLKLTLGRKTWNLYLGDKSLEALYSALEPFTKDAETGTQQQGSNQPKSNDRARIKAIREWAQSSGVQYKGKPIGDRGRIPEEVIAEYDKAH